MVPSKGEVHREKCVDERRPESVDNAADISVVASPWQRPIGLNRSGKGRNSHHQRFSA